MHSIQVAGCSTYPGVSSGCGIATDTNVQTTIESSMSTFSATVSEVPVQVRITSQNVH